MLFEKVANGKRVLLIIIVKKTPLLKFQKMLVGVQACKMMTSCGIFSSPPPLAAPPTKLIFS